MADLSFIMPFILPSSDIQTIHKGKARSARVVQAVKTIEHLYKLKAKSVSDPWPVIEECLNIWSESEPTNYQSFLYNLQGVKESRRDRTYAASPTGSLRYTLDVPERVLYMIKMLYTTDELPMNKEFFREWAKRFPKMRVAEKI